MKNKAIIYLLLLVIGANIIQVFDRAIVEAEGPVVIPDEAIRLRILANSDSPSDQELKRKVRDAVNAEITTWVEDLTSIEAARTLIASRVAEVEEIANKVVVDGGIKQTVQVEYDQNVSFPTKIYGNFIYPAGQYEAILITIGNGAGANWWCVLFPPLCFLDFSNGDAVNGPQGGKASNLDDDKVNGPQGDKVSVLDDGKVNGPQGGKNSILDDDKVNELQGSKASNLQDDNLNDPQSSETNKQQDHETNEVTETVEVKSFLMELLKKIFN